MPIDWDPLWEIIEQNERFVLSSHVRPDADALGSELAFANLLQNRGKLVRVANPSPPPGTLRFLDPNGRAARLGEGLSREEVLAADVHVILDTSAWSQLDVLTPVIRESEATKVVIDHHVSSDDIGAIEFKDTTAEATGALVYDFAKHFDLRIDEDTANLLFCAIATDTGWFRFPATTSNTMRTIGDLIDHGAQPHVLYRQLYEQRSLARIRLAGRILGRVKVECDGRLAWIVVDKKDFEATGSAPSDTEELVNECLTIAGTEAAFIAVEHHNTIKFSLRSRSSLDVAAIAESFGGGGHKQASGAMVAGPLRVALGKVLAKFRATMGFSESGDADD